MPNFISRILGREIGIYYIIAGSTRMRNVCKVDLRRIFSSARFPGQQLHKDNTQISIQVQEMAKNVGMLSSAEHVVKAEY